MPLHELTLIDRAGFERTSDNILELITGTGVDPRPRLRVDVEQTGFFEGRIFRSWYEASLPAGQTAHMRFVATKDFIIHKQSFVIAVGYCRFSALTGSTPSGAWTNTPRIGVNRMSNRPLPLYEATCSLQIGGTSTGGTEVEVELLKSAGNSQQSQTVGGPFGSSRGLPAGEYYLRVQNLGNDTATGIYSLEWEEWMPRSSALY